MKDKTLNLEETEVSNTLGGTGEGRVQVYDPDLSDTLRHINLAGLFQGLVPLCGPMHLCVCVSEVYVFMTIS